MSVVGVIMSDIHAVTGAFGFTGRHIAHRLLGQGKKVITLTGKPSHLNPFGDQVKAYPYHFDQPDALTACLRGVDTLYNTYWVRFEYRDITYERAVTNTYRLLEAARRAGVRRIVHVSITNPSLGSPFPYFRGKAIVEEAIRQSGLSFAILRPAVIFGHQDVLINNIAYFLRRLLIFAIPGSGQYSLQPIYVEDLADLAISLAQADNNLIVDAVGPEQFTFNELVRLIAGSVHSRARIVHLPPTLSFVLSMFLGLLVQDVVLTRDELGGLMANLLVSDQPPIGRTSFRQWLIENAADYGIAYASELKRHFLQPH